MSSNEQQYDLAVIGGGISGIGVALLAAEEGQRVILIERGQLGGGASANSLRVIHGGFRYLQSLNLSRAIRSLRAQAEILKRFPEVTKPITCIMPLRPTGMKGRWPCTVGAFLYRLLGRVVGVPTTADVRVRLEGDLEPLAAFAPNGALIWNDGVIADLAGLQSVLRGALVTGGVEVREQVAIQSIELNDNHYRLRGAAFEAAAAVLVNCAGAGIGDVRTLAGIKGRARPNGWCKAFNLIVRPTLPTPHGVAVHGPDGRLFFLVPRGAYTAVGTSYQSLVGPPGRGKPTDEEVQNFLQQLMESQLPFLLSEQDIHAVEWGVLPTVGVGPSGPILQGEEQIYREGRYIEVVSTKWTTFLPQARAVLAEVALCS